MNQNKKMNVLVTLDEGYLAPLKVMLVSLFYNNPNVKICVWLIHESISDENIDSLSTFIESLGGVLEVRKVSSDFWKDAPTVKRYPHEMYFRLMCGEILPKDLDRILYLDPDTLVINSVEKLWELDLEGHMIGAATHTGLTQMVNRVNRIRLRNPHSYFNSGVMLIDLVKARELIHLDDIQHYLEKNARFLLLPDQDILNALYGKYILEVPEEIWNYDARHYNTYYTRSLGEHDIHWVLENTSIIHFCGQPKPWQKDCDNRYVSLYAHYQHHCHRLEEKLK